MVAMGADAATFDAGSEIANVASAPTNETPLLPPVLGSQGIPGKTVAISASSLA